MPLILLALAQRPSLWRFSNMWNTTALQTVTVALCESSSACFKKGIAEQLLYLIDEPPSKQGYLQDQVCGVGSCKVPIGEGNVPGQELVPKVQVPVLVQAKSGQG